MGCVLIFGGKVDGGRGEVVNESGWYTVTIATSIDVIGAAKEGEEVASEVLRQSGAVGLEMNVRCLMKEVGWIAV